VNKKIMNRLSKIILIISIAVFGFWFLPSTFARAADLEVQFEQAPLFSETNFLPGQSVSRWVKVTNNSSQSQKIATEVVNYPGFILSTPRPHSIPSGDLSRALSIVIKEKGGSDLYGGSTGEKYLYDFYQNGETYLSDISSGGAEEYEFEITFPFEKENEWQGATTTFDIVIGFQGTEGGNGGFILAVSDGSRGGSTKLFIYDEMVVSVGMNNVIISWRTNLSANSRIIYSAADQPHLFDSENPPNYGYANSTIINPAQVTSRIVSIGGLSPATTYFFRCVSHTASDKAISRELSFTTLGVAGAAEEIVSLLPEAPPLGKEDGIEPEVKGEFVEEEIITEEEEDEDLDKFLATAGAFMAAENLCWLFFIVIIILTALYLLSRDKKEKEIKKKDLIFLSILILLIVLYCIFCCSFCWILIFAVSLLFILFAVLRIHLAKSQSV